MRKVVNKFGKSATSITLVAAFVILMVSAGASVAISDPNSAFAGFGNKNEASKYAKPDFSTITGEGSNPPELRGDASALGMEKRWYEYITYATNPVGQFNLSSTQRVIYYDPYDYNSCLIMRVKNDISEWSTANEISFEYTTVETHVMRTETSNETFTTFGSEDTSGGSTSFTDSLNWNTTQGWTKELNETLSTSDEHQTGTVAESGFSWGLEEKLTFEETVTVGAPLIAESGLKFGQEIGSNQQWHNNEQTYDLKNHVQTASISASLGMNGSDGIGGSYDATNEATWSVAKKFEKATGISTTNGDEWSTSTSRSVSTTYLAQYFNEEGSPLSWKIVQYAVFMPLRYDLQTKVGNEWLTVYSSYSLITPIQGTCRAYMRNNVAYIEDWGTGLPVTWDDFWSSFFTTESLTATYKNNLYPDSIR